MDRPIIFLDFDGVLNTEQYQAQLAINGASTRDNWGARFDPRAVYNLDKLIEATNAGIVVSSSWRFVHTLDDLIKMWEVRELPGEIIDTIPCGPVNVSRGEDIESWLDSHGHHAYVIIDDYDDFFPSQHTRYVETNPVIGLSLANVQKAIDILHP